MGCDIHLWAERQADDGTWHLVTPLDGLRALTPDVDTPAVETVMRLAKDDSGPPLPDGFKWSGYGGGPLQAEHILEELKGGELPEFPPQDPDEDEDAYWERRDEDGMFMYYRRFYRGRNYWLFARLSNVRNYSSEPIVPIAEPRGLPADACAVLRGASDRDGVDGHSHSWQTLAELQAAFAPAEIAKALANRENREGAFDSFVECLRLLAKLHPDPTKLRIVYWYDN